MKSIFSGKPTAANEPLTKTIAQIISAEIDQFLRWPRWCKEAISNLKERINDPKFSQSTVSTIIQDWKNEVLHKQYQLAGSSGSDLIVFNEAFAKQLESLYSQNKLANELEAKYGDQKPTNLKNVEETNYNRCLFSL